MVRHWSERQKTPLKHCQNCPSKLTLYDTRKPLPNRGLRETAKLHQRILARLSPSPLAEDQLIRELKAAAAQIAPALVDLEIEGQIERQSGGMVSLSGNEHKDHKGH